MAKVWLQNGMATGPSMTATHWSAFSNSGRLCAVGPTAAHDVGCQFTNRVAGVVSSLYTRVVSNTWNAGGTYTFRLRYNDGASYGTNALTYNDLETGEKTATGATDSVASGDVLQYEWTRAGGGSGVLTPSIHSAAFNPSSGTAWHYGTGEKVSISTAGQSRFWNPVGDVASSTDENSNRMKIKVAQTVGNLSVQAFTNLRTTNTVFTIRKNNVDDTTLTLTFGNLETGIKEDATGTVSYAVDDYLSYRSLTSTGSEVMEVTNLMVKAVSSSTAFQFGAMGIQVVPAGSTEYVPAAGTMVSSTTTESNSQGAVPFGFTMSKFRGYARVNTTTANSTADWRKNGSTVATLTWASGEVGEKEDASTTVAVNSGDALNIRLIGGATGTSIEFNGFTALAAEAPATRTSGLLLGV